MRTTSPGISLRPPFDAHAVDVRAVRGAVILDVDAVAARLEARVALRGEAVALERQVVVVAAADGERGRVDRVGAARLKGARLDDHEPPELARHRLREQHDACWGERIIDSWAAAGRAQPTDDPPDEEIEQDKEGDLEDKEGGFDSNGGERH